MKDSTVRPFLWHGFFLALTMAMIEPNTVLPNFIGGLTSSPVAFGVMYSILLGAPSVFNLLFSRYLERFPYKRKFLLVGFITSGRKIGFEPYLLDIAPESRRTAYLGISGSLNLLDVLLPVVGGLFIARLGFTTAFIAVSAFMAVSFFLLRNRTCPDRPDR